MNDREYKLDHALRSLESSRRHARLAAQAAIEAEASGPKLRAVFDALELVFQKLEAELAKYK